MRRGGLQKGWINVRLLREQRPYVHLAVGRWVHCNAFTSGIALRCQPVVRRASVDKEALVRRGGVQVDPRPGWTKSAYAQEWGDVGRCEGDEGREPVTHRWCDAEREGHGKRNY